MKKLFTFSDFVNENLDYQEGHTAPNKESGSPIYDLSDVYPNDIYSDKAVKLYGDYIDGVSDSESIGIIQRLKDKPNRLITIYRAVPYLNKEIDKKIKDLNGIVSYYLRYGFFPLKNRLIDEIRTKYDDLNYDDMQKAVLNDLYSQIDSLINQRQKTIRINQNDWVTINKDYAKFHGQTNLNNNYKIVTKTVKAKDLYTDGNSIHEWGYSPDKK